MEYFYRVINEFRVTLDHLDYKKRNIYHGPSCVWCKLSGRDGIIYVSPTPTIEHVTSNELISSNVHKRALLWFHDNLAQEIECLLHEKYFISDKMMYHPLLGSSLCPQEFQKGIQFISYGSKPRDLIVCWFQASCPSLSTLWQATSTLAKDTVLFVILDVRDKIPLDHMETKWTFDIGTHRYKSEVLRSPTSLPCHVFVLYGNGGLTRWILNHTKTLEDRRVCLYEWLKYITIDVPESFVTLYTTSTLHPKSVYFGLHV